MCPTPNQKPETTAGQSDIILQCYSEGSVDKMTLLAAALKSLFAVLDDEEDVDDEQPTREFDQLDADLATLDEGEVELLYLIARKGKLDLCDGWGAAYSLESLDLITLTDPRSARGEYRRAEITTTGAIAVYRLGQIDVVAGLADDGLVATTESTGELRQATHARDKVLERHAVDSDAIDRWFTDSVDLIINLIRVLRPIIHRSDRRRPAIAQALEDLRQDENLIEILYPKRATSRVVVCASNLNTLRQLTGHLSGECRVEIFNRPVELVYYVNKTGGGRLQLRPKAPI